MSTRDLKHPWKPSVWIIWIGAIVLGSWLLQGIRIRVKEPYRKVYSVFSTVFLLLLLLAVAVGCPAACFGR